MRLRVEDLGLWVPTSGIACRHISFTADSAKLLLIAGGNGAGASILLSAIAGRLAPGVRRVGQIWLADTDISYAHYDDIADYISIVNEAGLAPAMTVADMLALNRREVRKIQGSALETNNPVVASRAALVARTPGEFADRFGLTELLDKRVRDLTVSQQIRARLASAMLADRPVLLLDQILAPLSSAWRAKVLQLVKEFLSLGRTVIWADQQIDQVLTIADSVYDLTDLEQHDAWAWRPVVGDWTVLQRVASAAEVVRPGSNTVNGLREAIRPLLPANLTVPTRAKISRVMVPLKLAEHIELSVSEASTACFLCETEADRAWVLRGLQANNLIQRAKLRTDGMIKEICHQADRAHGLAKGAALEHVSQLLPTVRASLPLSLHSEGERALIKLALEFLNPTPRILVEPYAFLDRINCAKLRQALAEDANARQLNIVVTTDVEVATEYARVFFVAAKQIRADGRLSAILPKVEPKPLLAQVTAPRLFTEADVLIENLREQLND